MLMIKHYVTIFVIFNTSVCPSLVHPFQTVPPNKIPQTFVHDADVMIRGALKEILQLPMDIPNDTIYAETKLKGLGLFCTAWEIHVQHINTCNLLMKSNNMLLASTKNFIQPCSFKYTSN